MIDPIDGFFSKTEMEALWSVLKGKGDGFKGRCYRALFGVLCGTGIRVTEACNLAMSDLRLDHEQDGEPVPVMWVKRLKKKKANRDLVLLPGKVHEYLKDWLEYRGTEPGPVFLRNNGKSWTRVHAWQVFSNLLKQAGVRHRKLHALRHTFVVEDIEATGNIYLTSKKAGHSSVRTTQEFYADARLECLRKSTEKLGELQNYM